MIIFARERHNYQSYTDFWELVRLCDYELCYIDEIDIRRSDITYIITSPDVNHEWRNPKCRIIFWLLEWYGDYYQRPGVSETWCSNIDFAVRIGARFVPVGSHIKLGSDRQGEIYDIAHMSYDGIHRRGIVLGELRNKGIRIAPNGWGTERHKVLTNTRAMLHIHQHADYPAIAPLRVALAAAYRLPFISENGWNIKPFEDKIVVIPYGGLIEEVPKALKHADLDYYSKALFDLLCDEMRFDKVIEGNV